MRVVIVDRRGAQAIWGLMNAIAEQLVSRGDEVHFVRWDDGGQREPLPVPDGVVAHEVRVPGGRGLWKRVLRSRRFAAEFRSLLRGIAPDIVHTNFAVPGCASRRIAKEAGVPAVVSTQHELYQSMATRLRWSVSRSEQYADAIVYISQTVARSFSCPEAAVWDGVGSAPRNLVIPNGVDTGAYCRNDGEDRAVRVPGRLLCVGRLVKIKGHELLPRALPQILKAVPDAHIRIAGAGPEEERLRALSTQLGITDRVAFLGWQTRTEVVRELHAASVSVLSSLQEGFGLAAVEAMAAGTPIVASRIPAYEEVLGRDGECAVTFELENVASLTAAVERALADPAGCSCRAERAQERAQKLFASERMASTYSALYGQLLE